MKLATESEARMTSHLSILRVKANLAPLRLPDMAAKQPRNPRRRKGTPYQQRRPSPVAKRSVKVSGKTTSVSAEKAFWEALAEIAKAKGVTMSDLISMINVERGQHPNLSSAVRLFVLEYYRGPS